MPFSSSWLLYEVVWSALMIHMRNFGKKMLHDDSGNVVFDNTPLELQTLNLSVIDDHVSWRFHKRSTRLLRIASYANAVDTLFQKILIFSWWLCMISKGVNILTLLDIEIWRGSLKGWIDNRHVMLSILRARKLDAVDNRAFAKINALQYTLLVRHDRKKTR